MGYPYAVGFCFRILFGCLESQSELSWLFVDRDRLTSPKSLDSSGYLRLSPALWLYAVLRLLPGHCLSFFRSTDYRFHGTRQISLGKFNVLRGDLVANTYSDHRQILGLTTMRWLTHRVRLTALHFRSIPPRIYDFFRTTPRGPPGVGFPPRESWCSTAQPLSLRCWVASVRPPGWDFHLLYVEHASHTQCVIGARAPITHIN